MSTDTKATLSKSDKLTDYLAGKGPLPREYFSMGNFTEALLKLRDDEDVDQDEVAVRAKSLIRSHHAVIEELTILRRALQARKEGEPLFFALMSVRQAFARRRLPRRRR